MIEELEKLDAQFVLFINGFHTPVLDEIMWIISTRGVWIPFYILILFLVYKKNNIKTALLFLVSAALLVFISDWVSVHGFKNIFLRYRPSHNLLLQNHLHFYQMSNGTFYKGGAYGFISSHAANFSAITSFSLFVLKNINKNWFLLIPMFLVCYSRVYLGVHYLSDVFVGVLLGMGLAFLMYKFLFSFVNKKIQNEILH